MKKKTFFVAMLALTLCSCGSSSKQESTQTEETEITETSSLSDALEVEDVIESAIEEVVADNSSSTSSSEIDEYLDAYEDYIDKYVKLMKKAQSGDLSALGEYTEMMEKAQDIASKLENIQGDFNAKQLARLAKLQAKFTQAAM